MLVSVSHRICHENMVVFNRFVDLCVIIFGIETLRSYDVKNALCCFLLCPHIHPIYPLCRFPSYTLISSPSSPHIHPFCSHFPPIYPNLFHFLLPTLLIFITSNNFFNNKILIIFIHLHRTFSTNNSFQHVQSAYPNPFLTFFSLLFIVHSSSYPPHFQFHHRCPRC